MVYTTGVSVQVYIDNDVVVQKNESVARSLTAFRSGHILIGRQYANDDATSQSHGELTVDWLTIWDQPLSEEERNLVHQGKWHRLVPFGGFTLKSQRQNVTSSED